MRREVRPHEPTWLDRKFRKAFQKLDQKARASFESKLARLIVGLKACRHPIRDPDLAPFRPTPYRFSLPEPARLAEYRLGSTWRVLVGYREPGTECILLLVFATLSHDHDRAKRVLEQHRKALGLTLGADSPEA